MQNFISFLPYLACPIGMGLAMWFMMRDGKGKTTDVKTTTSVDANQTKRMGAPSDAVTVASTANGSIDANQTRRMGAPPKPNRMEAAGNSKAINIAGMCFNPRVLVGLGVIGLAVLVLAPDLAGAALPLLLIAACPLSMIFMMRGMGSGGSGSNAHSVSQPRYAHGPESNAAGDFKSGLPLTELKAQLADIEAQREAIARQIAELEPTSAPTELPREGATHELAPLAGGAAVRE